jgi:hypothetical protein
VGDDRDTARVVEASTGTQVFPNLRRMRWVVYRARHAA